MLKYFTIFLLLGFVIGDLQSCLENCGENFSCTVQCLEDNPIDIPDIPENPFINIDDQCLIEKCGDQQQNFDQYIESLSEQQIFNCIPLFSVTFEDLESIFDCLGITDEFPCVSQCFTDVPSPSPSPNTPSPSPNTPSPSPNTPSPEESPDIPDISLEKPNKENSDDDDSWFDDNKNWFIPVIAVVGVVILLTSFIVCAKFRFIT